MSGGESGAQYATLAIMVGGERGAFDRGEPLLRAMGRTITWCGPSGAGQLTMAVRTELTDIQTGRSADRHGWLRRLA